jgi:spore coat protein H
VQLRQLRFPSGGVLALAGGIFLACHGRAGDDPTATTTDKGDGGVDAPAPAAPASPDPSSAPAVAASPSADASPPVDAWPDGASDRSPSRAPDAAAPMLPPGVATVFDTKVLHRIDITVDDQYLLPLDQMGKIAPTRYPCVVVFDGITLASAGIRKKGGPGSQRPLAGKPAFSIKFNEFIKGQKLHGLSKLLLNNAVQDGSFLNEHLAYEMVRRAGSAAPLTAHGIVSLNGRILGLYVLREAFNDDFAERNWGRAGKGGNFYESGNFIEDANSPTLKDEKEEMRSREDLRALVQLVKKTPDPQWVPAVSAKLDLHSVYVAWAIEALVDHWDGYFFTLWEPNNYYAYHEPVSDRFVLLVAGMDAIFNNIKNPLSTGKWLAMKIRQLPEARVQMRDTLSVIVRDFDVPAMLARIDEAARTIHSYSPTDPPTIEDYSRFDKTIMRRKQNMSLIAKWVVPSFDPPPDAGAD